MHSEDLFKMKCSDAKMFGVIVEFKDEGPLIMEGKLSTYDEDSARLTKFTEQNRVIRGAVFLAQFASGNESLIPEDK